MTLKPLAFACPQCGSYEVVYSCKPDCCFNHVCSQCYTTFEPVTTKTGELTSDIGPFPPDADPTGHMPEPALRDENEAGHVG